MKNWTANQLAIILFNLPEAANGNFASGGGGLEGIHALASHILQSKHLLCIMLSSG